MSRPTWKICSTILFFCFLAYPAPVFPEEFQAGQTVVLHARKPVGVPLHRSPSPSFWKHVPTESRATIQKVDKASKWLYVILDSGEAGWVSPRYVQSSSSTFSKEEDSAKATSDEAAVWASPEQCQQMVETGGRMVPASTSTLRLATWNIRWFPDGFPQGERSDVAEKTDLAWLVCTIVWMQVDILAVQESLATPEANQAWNTIIQSLEEKTGHSWGWTPQPCGQPDDHHLGFLWNTDRVSLSGFDTLWQFNVKAKRPNEPCAGGLRPGFYARVSSREPQGADFHLIALHLKSGPTVFAVENRHQALNRIDKSVAPLLGQDQDVVILGDFNTMGAGDKRSKRYELKGVRRLVAKEGPGFHDLQPNPQCTHYFRGRGGRLDHILVAKGMTEVSSLSARVTGYCAVAHCRKIKGKYPLAYRRLSDHCPVIVEIQNHDED